MRAVILPLSLEKEGGEYYARAVGKVGGGYN